MKRWKGALRHLIIFGLLGVVMSYSVAWGLALQGPPKGSSSNYRLRGYWSGERQGVRISVAYEAWFGVRQVALVGLKSVPQCAFDIYDPTREYVYAIDSAKGMPDELAGWSALPVDECFFHGVDDIDTLISSVVNSGGTQYAVYRGSGWPMLAMVSRADRPDGRALSVRPIAGLGLVVNSLMYGSLLGLLWLTPGMIRRAVRRRRGLCVRCGYDLRGAVPGGHGGAPCPECGGVLQ